MAAEKICLLITIHLSTKYLKLNKCFIHFEGVSQSLLKRLHKRTEEICCFVKNRRSLTTRNWISVAIHTSLVTKMYNKKTFLTLKLQWGSQLTVPWKLPQKTL